MTVTPDGFERRPGQTVAERAAGVLMTRLQRQAAADQLDAAARDAREAQQAEACEVR